MEIRPMPQYRPHPLLYSIFTIQPMLLYNLLKPPPYLLLSKPPRLSPQHIRNLSLTHTNLVANGEKPSSKIRIVFLQELDRHHEIVDIVKHKRTAGPICFLRFQEVEWVVPPVPPWIQVVRGVVAVVEAEAVALCTVSMEEKYGLS